MWQRSLSRRSQKGDVVWGRMKHYVDKWLPVARIYHPYPNERFGVMTLISCGGCGCKFVGGPKYNQKGRTGYYYRCGGQMSSVHPENGKKCKAKLIEATWLENFVWQDCREFILNPGAALAEAKKQLQGRMLLEDQLERERRALQQALAQKTEEREQVMVLFRKKKVTLVEAETQLNQVEKEAVELRTTLRGLESQKELTQTFAEHYQEAEGLLLRLRDRLSDVEAKDDFATKRQVVELLVTGIAVPPQGGLLSRPRVVFLRSERQSARIAGPDLESRYAGAHL